MPSLSDQVRKAITNSGMTYYRIAVLGDLPFSTLTRFMQGRDISTASLDRLAGPLGLRITTGKRRRTKGR